MASGHRKPLYADLFKPPPKPKLEIPASWTSASSWSHSLLSFDSSSSSSGFTTPPCSELASSVSEDDVDFIGELTRQMAEECMVQEEEEDDRFEGREFDQNCENDVNSSDSTRTPPTQVNELKNQPPAKKVGRKRRVKAAESGSGQSQSLPHRVNGYFPGAGMQAIYLGGPRSVGTGVFLPRLNSEPEPARVKKKSGSGGGKGTRRAMVLIPTRVLQVLHHHFNHLQQVQDSITPTTTTPSPNNNDETMVGSNSGGYYHEDEDEDEDVEEIIELPKEWTYTLD